MKTLIAWDLDGTLIASDVVPLASLEHRCKKVCIDFQTFYVYVRPFCVETLHWFMDRKDEYLNVMFSAADVKYVDAMIAEILYPALGAGYHFDAVYDRNCLIGGYKNVTAICCAELEYGEAVLVDDMWDNCVHCGCRYICVPTYDPYKDETLFEDRSLLHLQLTMKEGANFPI